MKVFGSREVRGDSLNLVEAREHLLAAEFWDDVRRIFVLCPELLREKGDSIVDEWVAEVGRRGDLDADSFFLQIRGALSLCRQIGVDDAFDRLSEQDAEFNSYPLHQANAEMRGFMEQKKNRWEWRSLKGEADRELTRYLSDRNPAVLFSAIGGYEEALKLVPPADPDRPACLDCYALSLAQAGRLNDALRVYREALELARTDSPMRRTLVNNYVACFLERARDCARLGDRSGVKASLGEAERLGRETDNPSLLDTVVRVRHELESG